MVKTAFLGLGVMGAPMAGHLATAGHEVTVYNRTGAKAEAWVKEHGGRAEATPEAAAKGQEIVFCCVGNDDDLREVAIPAIEAMEKGALFVDHTTASAEVARELGELAASRGVGFVDAPVSGGQAGAENGVLTVMCGGAQADFDRAQPVIDAFARSCVLMGPVASGQLTKMVNQICIAGLLQALSEGMNFAAKAGLDGEKLIDVISKGAAGSWQMENRGKTMLADEFDFGFAVDWMRKDLAICLAEGERNGAALPVTALVDQFYKDVQGLGGNRWDTSSLMRRLTK
ncbi:NAD(P)-dependent oxidoreductase [Paracoccaceae bacterium GXU_MW_L88]